MIKCNLPIISHEMGIYFEYAYLRDLWDYIGDCNEIKREVIYNFLKPTNIQELKKMKTYEFNSYFGAISKPSSKYIQSPSRWSILKYKDTICDNDEFLKVSKFKWAFNAKPDIVINSDLYRM